jgi:hypothetical protein
MRRCGETPDRAANREERTPIMRRVAVLAGWILAALGFAAGLVSLALPWALLDITAEVNVGGSAPTGLADSQGVAVFQLDTGWWYLLGLAVTAGLLAGAAAAGAPAARTCGALAVPAGLLTAGAVLLLAARIETSSLRNVTSGLATMDLKARAGTGLTYGLAAGLLLGLGTALVSLRARHRSAVSTTAT